MIKQYFKFPLILFLITIYGICQGKDNPVSVSSPDGHLKIQVTIADSLYYKVYGEANQLLFENTLALTLSAETLGQKPVLINTKRKFFEETIKPYVPVKFSTVKSAYNNLLLTFKNGYAVEFRAFNDGVAYRFITKRKGQINVTDEKLRVKFPQEYSLHVQQVGGFKTSYEDAYSHMSSANNKQFDRMATLPLLIDTRQRYKILLSESDLSDYPAMFLRATGSNGLRAVFPKVPTEFGPDGDRSVKILKTAPYIAQTKGDRTFPWRYFVITKDDKQLVENTMTLKLAPKSVIANPSWIQPGQASWEWWNDAAPYGPDVNFVSGYNLDTYKYYIDFASKYKLKYIVMDEGWAKSTTDPYTPNPQVNVKELIRYGKEKNVGIILWLTWLTVHNNMDLFKTFHDWGVKGVKIDFMDRSDQWMVNYYEDVVKEAARYEMFVDFHGAFKPAGLEYKYPNLLSYEGVRGLEQMGGCRPDNSLYFPFMRNAVGPMDYTPGAMISMQPEYYQAARPNAASIGTRAYQMALFVVFESGIQMLADNPTLYYRNPDCTEFIANVPTTWDETKALVAEAGKVVIVAKRKGQKWFIGGITNGEKTVRDYTIKLDFLSKDKSYTVTAFEDGINAGRQAMDYKKTTGKLTSADELRIHMARNGGFAAVLE